MRVFLFLLTFGLSLTTLPVLGQTSASRIFLPAEESESQSQWNPYPGLGDGKVAQSCYPTSPRYPNGSLALPNAVKPFATQYDRPAFPYTTMDRVPGPIDYSVYFQQTVLPPTRDSGGGELYVSRLPVRNGAFQKVNFNAMWNPSSGGVDGLGISHLDLSAIFAIPFTQKDSPLIITPTVQAWHFDPKDPDHSNTIRKGEMYTMGVDFRWVKMLIRDKFSMDIGFAALYSGDLHAKGSDSMRFPGHIAGIWNCNPRVKVVGGVMYLDRKDDYKILPMGGIIWTPNDDLSFELLFPRMRIAQRCRWWGSAAGDDNVDWIYAGCEFDGGSWAYREDGFQTQIDYRDVKALLGWERRCGNGLMLGFEVGYMFGRKIEYSTIPDAEVTAPSSVFLRFRSSF